MASQNKGTGTGATGWGIGLAAVAAIIAAGLYISGVFSPVDLPETSETATPPETSAPEETETAQEPKPQTSVTSETAPEPQAPTPAPDPTANTSDPTPTDSAPTGTSAEPDAALPQPEVQDPAAPEPAPEPATDGAEPAEDAGSPDAVPAVPAPTGTDPAENTPDPAPSEAEPAAGPDPEPETSLSVPVFDVVRVDTEGNTVIAGSAEPGSEVTILVDQQQADVVLAGPDGKFVSLLTLPLADAARVLTLKTQLNGQQVLSEEDIIVAPTQRVAQAAAADIAGEKTPQVAQDDSGTPASSAEIAQDAAPDPQPAQNGIATAAPEPEPAPAAPADADAETAETADPAPSTAPADEPAETVVAALPAPEADPVTPSVPANGDDPVAPRTAPQPETTPAGETITDAPEQTQATLADQPAAGGPSTPEPEQAQTPVEPEKPAGVAVLRAGKDGVEVIQPATPPVPEEKAQIVLDTISYSETGAVLLRGTAQGGSVVRVYLDNTPVADLDTNAKGRWRGKVDDVTPGVYTLRLDELDTKGQVLSRLETPFKREAPEVLQPATAAAAAAPGEGESPIRAVTVQAGDTLWAISRERYGDGVLYVRVFEANRNAIKDPDLIYPGQVFTIPE